MQRRELLSGLAAAYAAYLSLEMTNQRSAARAAQTQQPVTDRSPLTGADSMQRHGKGLRESSARELDALLRDWHERAQAPRPAGEPVSYFPRLRELAIIAFCTSEVGQTEVLEAQFGAGQNTEAGPVIKPPPFRL